MYVPCPPNVVLYNKFMGEWTIMIGFAHTLQASIQIQKNLTPTFFWFLLDVCIINAFLLMRHFGASTHSKLSQIKHFRVKLAEGLVGSYNSRQKYSLGEAVRNEH